MQFSSEEQAFVQDMLEYSIKCSEKSSQESEEAVLVVGKILDLLVQDAARISKMSQETLDALNAIRNLIASARAKGETESTSETLRNLILALQKLSKEDTDINACIIPIIEALQFQDRIRQQMQNLIKIIELWFTYRKRCLTERQVFDPMFLDFGNACLDATTTPQEREVIHGVLPHLPRRQEVSDNAFFF